MSACEQPKPATRQCDGLDCTSCASLTGYAVRALDLADTFAGMVKTLLAQRDEMARALREHEETVAGLEAERQKYAEINRRLSARKRHTGGYRLREERVVRKEGQAPGEGGHGKQAVWGGRRPT